LPDHLPTDPRLHFLFDAAAWAAAFVTARLLYRWRLAPVGDAIAATLTAGYVTALVGGAIVGAVLLGSAYSLQAGVPHLSHSVAGALAGAIVAIECYKAATGMTGSTGVIWVGSLCVGIAVGRLGCLFAGVGDDTFGIPTALPWGIDLGDGIARHPVQLYESLSMLGFLAVYLVALRGRAAWTNTRAFYWFVGWYAAQRFVWEFLKPYPRIAGPLDIFQLCALGLLAYAWWFDARTRHRSPAQN
jgi:prolipoprotein diacylglyceryltransferase